MVPPPVFTSLEMLLTSSADLDADVVLQAHQRLDLELQADVEVVHRLGDEAGGAGGRGDHRHLVADVDARLLLALHADARVGEHVGAAGLLAQIERDQRVAHVEAHQLPLLKFFASVPVIWPGMPAAPITPAASRPGHSMPSCASCVVPDLEHLDFEHHLGLAEVLAGDQLLDHADRLGRVAHHQQVQLLVDEDVARLDEAAHHVRGLLHVRVGEIEALHRELAVGLRLGRRVRVDQHGVRVERAALELARHQHEAQHFLDRGVAHEHRDAQVGRHVAVVDEVQAAPLGDQLEHGAHRRVAQLDGDGVLERRGELRAHRLGLDLLLLDLAHDRARVALRRVVLQHCSRLARAVSVSPRFIASCASRTCALRGALARHGVEPGLGVVVVGVEALRAAGRRPRPRRCCPRRASCPRSADSAAPPPRCGAGSSCGSRCRSDCAFTASSRRARPCSSLPASIMLLAFLERFLPAQPRRHSARARVAIVFSVHRRRPKVCFVFSGR